MFIEPKEIQIDGKTFVIHKIPAVTAIKVMVRFSQGIVPALGKFEDAEDMMVEIMKYVAIKRKDKATNKPLPDLFLGSKDLIDNHCVDYKTYLSVLGEIVKYNEFFFLNGNTQDFSVLITQTLPAKLCKILNLLSPSLSPNATPPSTS